MTSIVAGCGSHVGSVRTQNEDAVVVDSRLGLFVVCDGMGGAAGGEVASQLAVETIATHVRRAVSEGVLGPTRSAGSPPGTAPGNATANNATKEVLGGAIQAACRAIFAMAKSQPELTGMGTTVVVAHVDKKLRATIAHVGDSRGYLVRDGRLQQLTRDHTIVAELVNRGVISLEEAETHAYKNVLSRNLGAKKDAQIDFAQIQLQVGDRLLLCSDGLYGFCNRDVLAHLVCAQGEPQAIVSAAIDAALRGGGGDNVSVVVIDARGEVPTSTQIVRTSGSIAWWQVRHVFRKEMETLELADLELCRNLAQEHGPRFLADNLCQAVFHDLEKSTSINVWTFCHSLVTGWLGNGGAAPQLRAVLAAFIRASNLAVEEICNRDQHLGGLMHIAVTRALVVAELSLGSGLSEQIVRLDDELVRIEAAKQFEPEETSKTFVEQPTMPFLGRARRTTGAGAQASQQDRPRPLAEAATAAEPAPASHAEVVAAADRILKSTPMYVASNGPVPAPTEESRAVVEAVAACAAKLDDPSTGPIQVAELLAGKVIDETTAGKLFDEIERLRFLAFSAAQRDLSAPAFRARVLTQLVAGLDRLCHGFATSAANQAAPLRERAKEASLVTAQLRASVHEGEKRLAKLEAARKQADRPGEEKATP